MAIALCSESRSFRVQCHWKKKSFFSMSPAVKGFSLVFSYPDSLLSLKESM